MATIVATSYFTTESAMGLDLQLSHEKRVAELEGQIQALLAWKGSILANFANAIQPACDSSATFRRRTLAVVPSAVNGRMSATHIPPTPVVVEKEPTLLAAHESTSTLVDEEGATPQLPPLLKQGKPQLSSVPAPHGVAHKIMDVLQVYGKHTQSAGPDGHRWLGREKFLPRVEEQVRKQQTVKMIMPSFPWKSINRVDKVTGALPDLGEELAIARLNALCVDIGKVYEHGAEVHIATDGLVFNDVVGISDDETWEYSVALMALAANKGFTQVKLVRVMDMLGYADKTTPLTKDQYMALVGRTRAELESQFGNPLESVRHLIETDADTLQTYRGFIRFLETDLRHSPVAAHARSGHQYRRIVKDVAMKMMMRAESFTKIILARCPDYVRLSVHPSSGTVKLSVPLLVERGNPGGFPRTPWHSAIAVGVDGEYRSVHAKDVRETHDLIAKDGRAWCFRERSHLFALGDEVEIEHLYPWGIEVRPRAATAGRLGPVAEGKLRRLARLQPVNVVGFIDAPRL